MNYNTTYNTKVNVVSEYSSPCSTAAVMADLHFYVSNAVNIG